MNNELFIYEKNYRNCKTINSIVAVDEHHFQMAQQRQRRYKSVLQMKWMSRPKKLNMDIPLFWDTNAILQEQHL